MFHIPAVVPPGKMESVLWSTGSQPVGLWRPGKGIEAVRGEGRKGQKGEKRESKSTGVAKQFLLYTRLACNWQTAR